MGLKGSERLFHTTLLRQLALRPGGKNGDSSEACSLSGAVDYIAMDTEKKILFVAFASPTVVAVVDASLGVILQFLDLRGDPAHGMLFHEKEKLLFVIQQRTQKVPSYLSVCAVEKDKWVKSAVEGPTAMCVCNSSGDNKGGSQVAILCRQGAVAVLCATTFVVLSWVELMPSAIPSSVTSSSFWWNSAADSHSGETVSLFVTIPSIGSIAAICIKNTIAAQSESPTSAPQQALAVEYFKLPPCAMPLHNELGKMFVVALHRYHGLFLTASENSQVLTLWDAANNVTVCCGRGVECCAGLFYDPDYDIVIVVGGEGRCALFQLQMKTSGTSTSFELEYAATAHTPPGTFGAFYCVMEKKLYCVVPDGDGTVPKLLVNKVMKRENDNRAFFDKPQPMVRCGEEKEEEGNGAPVQERRDLKDEKTKSCVMC